MKSSTFPPIPAIRPALLAGIAALLLLSSAAAQTVIVYSEDFAGDGASTLIGTPEDTTGTVAWEGNTLIRDNGLVPMNRGPALLPFSPVNGMIYTATITMDLPTTVETMSFGFAEFIDPVRFHNQSGLTGWAWMFTQPGTGQSAWEGPRGLGDGNVEDGVNEFLDTGLQTLKIVLNTTAPVWTASFFVNDLVFTEDMELNGLGEGMIQYVGVAAGNNNSAVLEAFELTSETSTSPPVLMLTAPPDDAADVPTPSLLVASFDKPVQPGASGIISIHRAGDGTVVETFDVTSSTLLNFDGSDLTIDPSDSLLPGEEFYILIPPDAVVDAGSRGFVGITTPGEWSFTTDGTPPTTTGTGPMAGGTGASQTGNLTLTFDEPVITGTGNLTLFLADGTLVETIAIASGAVSVTGSKVTVEIDDLAPGTAYYVNIDAGAFTDDSGNAYPGVSDDSTWAFTTTSRSVSFIKITGDDDCGISPEATYTHAIDFGRGNSPATVNGVEFVDDFNDTVALAGGGTRDNPGSRTYGASDHNGLAPGNLTGAIAAVLTDIDFKGPDLGTVTLTGLTPGERYDLRLYDRAYNGQFQLLSRRVTLSYDIDSDGVNDHTTAEIDTADPTAFPVLLDGDFAWVTSFVYVAGPEGSISVTFDLNDDDLALDHSYHLYGLTNAVVPDPSEPLTLRISSGGGTLGFTWNSIDNMQYDLVSSTGLSTAPSTWLPYDDGTTVYENIPFSGTGTNTLSGVLPSGATRFFALIEEEIPPLFSEDFDDSEGGFVSIDNSAGGTGSVWEYGIPNSDGGAGGGAVTTGNGGTGRCWGTDISNPGTYLPGTDTSLRSPPINLAGASGATLSFAAALDVLSPGTIAVNLIDANTNGIIASGLYTDDDAGTVTDADWNQVSGIDLAAGLGKLVIIEWRFTAANTDGTYIGAYIDDVRVDATAL